MQTVSAAFIKCVTRDPDKQFIQLDSENITYAQALSRIKKIAQVFLSQGLQEGDRVILHLPNSVEIVYGYLACFYLGCIPVPLGYYLTASEVHYIVNETRPALILTHLEDTSNLNTSNNEAAGAISLSIKQLNTVLLTTSEIKLPPNENEKTQAVIHYTSGSTGKPKGVVHRQLHQLMQDYTRSGDYHADDNVLVTLSLTHGFAFSFQFLPVIYVGASLVISHQAEPQTLVTILNDKNISTWATIPSLLKRVVAKAKQKPLKHTLRACVVGGDAISETLLEQFYRVFNLQLSDCWGLTEAFCVTLNKPGNTWKSGSSGLPCEGDNIKVDEKGEIWVSGSTVMAEYYNQPVATERVLQQGWLKTGDYGEIDQGGYLWFKGRMKDIIIIDAHNVSPLEVEKALCDIEEIKEAVVYGVPDAEWGQKIVAVVVADKLTANFIKDQLRSKIAFFKIPEQIYFVTTLPKTAFGKIDKHALRARYY